MKASYTMLKDSISALDKEEKDIEIQISILQTRMDDEREKKRKEVDKRNALIEKRRSQRPLEVLYLPPESSTKNEKDLGKR